MTRRYSVTDDLENRMDREWNDSQPIYRQLRDRVVAMILDGVLKEGDPLPSVRNVAAEYRVNPLTVLKGYQQLVDEGLVESGADAACSSTPARASCCCKGERQKFLDRRMAADPGDDSAAGTEGGRPAGWQRNRHDRRSRQKRSAEAMACIEARGLRKTFGTTVALDGIDLRRRRGPHPRTHRP